MTGQGGSGLPTEEPTFSRTVTVSQDQSNDIMGLSIVLGGSMGLSLPMYWWVTRSGELSGWAVFGLVVWSFVALILSMLMLWVIETYMRRLRGLPPLFRASCQVEIGPNGLSIDGLGHLSWAEVLAPELIPDSDSYLVVHTRSHHRLLMSAPVDELLPVIRHYISRHQEAQRQNTATTPVFEFRAVVFRWTSFRAWIWLGYLLAGAVAWVLLWHAPEKGLGKLIVGLCILVPMVAGLVWAIPLAQLSLFAASRTQYFRLEGTQLVTGLEHRTIDMSTARVTEQLASGIGFNFCFVSIRPAQGSRLDLRLSLEDQRQLMNLVQVLR